MPTKHESSRTPQGLTCRYSGEPLRHLFKQKRPERATQWLRQTTFLFIWQRNPARAGKTVSATCGYPIRQDHPRPGTVGQRPTQTRKDPRDLALSRTTIPNTHLTLNE